MLTQILACNSIVIQRFIWIFRSAWIVILWQFIQNIVLVCNLGFQYHTTTSRTETIAISNTFIIIKNFGITCIAVTTNREQMRLCNSILPIVRINQLSTNTSELIGFHDTTLLLIHVRYESDRLNQFQSFLVIYIPTTLITQ